MNLLNINDLDKNAVIQIWNNVSSAAPQKKQGNIAWSFEGNGIRTRTTFIQAFQRLGMPYVELPNFLKTSEPVQDLAGYMDPFYSLYVLRDSNHDRMTAFAMASEKPVINAMSSEAHPCEVLTDAYYLQSKYMSLSSLRILLWGPVTNVFKSWHALAEVLALNMTHYCPTDQHTAADHITYTNDLSGQFDVVITDAWPNGFSDASYSLSTDTLLALGSPELLPTPPATVGNEVLFPPASYPHFSGYHQKQLLLPVQEAIITYLLTTNH